MNNINRPETEGFSRRQALLSIGAGLAGGLSLNALEPHKSVEASEMASPVMTGNSAEVESQATVARVPWENGKLVQISRSFYRPNATDYVSIFHHIDVGTLGPDVDVIFGIDFLGAIDTGAEKLNDLQNPRETRVVGIKRTDLDYVQFNDALGGDLFYVFRVSEHGGDRVLDAMARLHARNSAHTHQRVVYIGDLGLFETQYPNEEPFLRTIIRAQRPSRLGIPESNFVFPRT